MSELTPNLNALDMILSPITNLFSPRFPTVLMVGDQNTDGSGASCPTPAPPANFIEIGVQDQSTKGRLKVEDIAAMIEAVNIQLKEFAVHWKTALYQLRFHARNDPIRSRMFIIFKDNTDIEGALGYHTKTSDDDGSGYVFVETILNNASNGILKRKIMAGRSVANIFSHEVLEMIGNPYVSRLHIISFRRTAGLVYIQPSGTRLSAEQASMLPPILEGLVGEEVCDPVQRNYTVVKVQNKDVEVSDFIFPTWFGDDLTGPFNFKETLPGPQMLDIGGYIRLSIQQGQLIIMRTE